MPQKLGFLGTGAITSAMVTGLHAAGGRYAVRVSPRNPATAAGLARRFPEVSVASSNQEVLDACDTVVIAVRPQIAESVLAELRFRADHKVISVVSGFSVRRIAGLVAPAPGATRAVPLPAAARRLSPTAIYPPDRQTLDIFTQLGDAFAVDSEKEFSAVCAASAAMATYFALADGVAGWLAQNGIPPERARDHVAQLFFGLAQAAMEPPKSSFQTLSDDHATRGGTNEQVLAYLRQNGVFERLSEALDGVMRRVTASLQPAEDAGQSQRV